MYIFQTAIHPFAIFSDKDSSQISRYHDNAFGCFVVVVIGSSVIAIHCFRT